MQSSITLNMLSAVSEKGFSLDELVIETKTLFEQEGMAGIVGLILGLFDEKVCIDMVAGKRNAQKPCCGLPRYHHQGSLDRQFRTSVGAVKICWRRLECQHCGRTTIPLRELLGLEPYQSKTSELEKMVAEVVSEQSYRRASSHLDIIGQIPVPKSTAHRWVIQSDCDKIDECKDDLDVLFADGTCYKRRIDKNKHRNNRGEVRLALGVAKNGSVVPLGAWSGNDWDQIAAEIKGKRTDGEKLADILVSDGEQGIAHHLSDLCNSQQRCHWHTVRDLNHALYLDAADKYTRDKMKKELAMMIGIELPGEDFEQANQSDKDDIMRATANAEYEVGSLIKTLVEKKYTFAADYLIRASKNLFSYVYRWLKTGIVTPRVSSFIERMMRELARRLKRMAFGWSEKGATKMARIIIKRFTSVNQWDAYWKKRLNIQGNVIMTIRSITATTPQPLGR